MLTMPTSNRRQSLIVLVVVLVAAYAINLDTTIVNVALPTLNLRLGAGTSSLQWVVDGYNLAFAALVLAGGNIGDRYGRRETLSVGLGGFAIASLLAALCTNVGELIAARFAAGAAAALIYPTTLSIITNTFPERKARAAAMREELASAPRRRDPAERARRRLRAIGRAYVSYAIAEPGLFRTIWAAAQYPSAQAEMSDPYLILNAVLDELVDTGAIPASHRPYSETVAWSAVHGLSMLVINGPLAGTPPAEIERALNRLCDVIDAGL